MIDPKEVIGTVSGLNGMVIKDFTISMFNVDGEETLIEENAVSLTIREVYNDGTFNESHGEFNTPDL